MSNKIILISKNEEDQSFARELATAAGAELILASSCKDGVSWVTPSGKEIALVDISTEEQLLEFNQVFGSKVGRASDQIHPRLIHLISNEDFQALAPLTNSEIFEHVLVRKYGNPQEAGKYYSRLIETIFNKTEFRIDSVLNSSGGCSIIKINHSTEKAQILDKTRKFLIEESGFSERVVDIVITGMDEILMNAIYDAPVDENGNQCLLKVPRDTPIALDSKSSVELQTGFNGEYVAFKVIDRFGSVNRKKLLKHILSGYEEKTYQVDDSVANAGIGLSTTFRMGASLVFTTEKGIKTEVTTFFKLSKSFREFKNQFRFVSLHFLPE